LCNVEIEAISDIEVLVSFIKYVYNLGETLIKQSDIVLGYVHNERKVIHPRGWHRLTVILVLMMWSQKYLDLRKPILYNPI
jgi:hypothetical protein